MNWELKNVQAGFRKGRGTRDQITNICWIIEKAREFQKNIYLCFNDYAIAFDYVDHNKLWKTLKEMEIPGHLTCFLRNFYAGQEVTEVCMEQLTASGLRKEHDKAICCHCLFNFHTEYIMRNNWLDELQAEIKISRRNSNLRYTNDTILLAESKEELKNL